MSNFLWGLIARILCRPAAWIWLVNRALRTPYTHIMSRDGTERYMGRWWLFNPYPASGEAKRRFMNWLPSVRLHHIARPDHDRHHHDHPWNARTIILRGWYREERDVEYSWECWFLRRRGDTASLKYGEYHRIVEVSPGGVWTLFITWKYRGTWGFNVDGVKVPWREYLDANNERSDT